MIDTWLQISPSIPSKYCFEFIHITEKKKPDVNIVKEIQKKILTSYATEEYLKFALTTATTEEITEYIKNQMVPEDKKTVDKNVRQGDFGEILAAIIANKFQNRKTFNKLQWKFNNKKAVFGTDLIAYDSDNTFSKLYYYEVKTRKNITKKEQSQYITVIAHNTLVKDNESKKEEVLNFFSKLAFTNKDYDLSKKLSDFSLHPEKTSKSFEIFIITETNTFNENVLSDLHSLPPALFPLAVTIVLIDNFKEFVRSIWKDIETTGVELV